VKSVKPRPAKIHYVASPSLLLHTNTGGRVAVMTPLHCNKQADRICRSKEVSDVMKVDTGGRYY